MTDEIITSEELEVLEQDAPEELLPQEDAEAAPLPERVTVDGREVSAVIAADESGTDYGGFDGIVPAGLVR